MTLNASLERLSNIAASTSGYLKIRDDLKRALSVGASNLEALLKDEQTASERSRERVLHLENEAQKRSATIGELARKEKAFEDKCREQVRNHDI